MEGCSRVGEAWNRGVGVWMCVRDGLVESGWMYCDVFVSDSCGCVGRVLGVRVHEV